MAKSLGQIHTINRTFNISAGSSHRVDIPAELTAQLQRMVRCGTYHKMVGLDINLDSTPGTSGAGSVSGRMLYYAPTRGRCSAFRGAFKAVADTMKLQGISMRDNPLYDFSVPLDSVGALSDPHKNQATLDGTTGLSLFDTANPQYSIFDVHNSSVRPLYTDTSAELFSEGFTTILQSGLGSGTDFVLNDSVPFTGSPEFADTTAESIPFQLVWSDVAGSFLAEVEWRPDPALFLALLCGQVRFVIDDFPSTTPGMQMNVAIMISGWKSIMGNPDKKKNARKRSHSSS